MFLGVISPRYLTLLYLLKLVYNLSKSYGHKVHIPYQARKKDEIQSLGMYMYMYRNVDNTCMTSWGKG